MSPGYFRNKLLQKTCDFRTAQVGLILKTFCVWHQFGDRLSPNCLVRIGQIETFHVAQVAGRKTGCSWERRPQIVRYAVNDGLSPTKYMLLVVNGPSDVPVEQDHVAVHMARRRPTGGGHPRLKAFDESAIVRSGQDGWIVFHWARPFNNASASFSSRRSPTPSTTG